MSSLLEKQLKELQKKKHKVEIFSANQELISQTDFTREGISSEFLEAEREVIAELETFIKERITLIENGELEQKRPTLEIEFTIEETQVLKGFAYKLLNAKNAPQVDRVNTAANIPRSASGAFSNDEDDSDLEVPENKQRKPNIPKRAANQDKIAFAMQNRHLDGKRCSVVSGNGNQIGGKIVGTDAPFLTIQTDLGHVINVEPEKVTVG